jgi:hypothetical protein
LPSGSGQVPAGIVAAIINSTTIGDLLMTNQTETTSKQPTHTVYYLKPKDGTDKSDWIKVGAAWEHGDKDGLNLSLNIMGQNVPVVVRRNKPKAD